MEKYDAAGWAHLHCFIGEKWKIEIQKHHYRLCFHIQGITDFITVFYCLVVLERRRISRALACSSQTEVQLNYRYRKMVKITTVRKKKKAGFVVKSNCANKLQNKALVWNSLNSERVHPGLLHTRHLWFFITDLDLNAFVHLANVKNLPSSRAGLMLSHSKAGAAQSRHRRTVGNIWASAYSHIPGRQFKVVMIFPIADIFIDVAILTKAVILFRLNPIITSER